MDKKGSIEEILQTLLGYREELHNKIADSEINDSGKRGLIAGLDKSIRYGQIMLKNYQSLEVQQAARVKQYDRLLSSLEANYKSKAISKPIYDKGKKELAEYKAKIDTALEKF